MTDSPSHAQAFVARHRPTRAPGRGRSALGRVLSVVLLFVLGVGIVGPAVDLQFELPTQHFDGDADDTGDVGKIFVYWVDPAVTETLTRVSWVPIRRRAPIDVPRPPQIPLEPLGSRAPPA